MQTKVLDFKSTLVVARLISPHLVHQISLDLLTLLNKNFEDLCFDTQEAIQYGSLKNAIKTNEINKGCSLSGVEWDTHGNQ
jgi:hypothetical protein